MATLYTIEVGYNPVQDNGEVWKKLVEVCSHFQNNPSLIAKEALRLEPTLNVDNVNACADCYLPPVTDLTIVFFHGDKMCVTQSASGSGVARDVKEACRRAFCRLVIEQMHRFRMEVNLVVG